jgi:hypothetical protein
MVSITLYRSHATHTTPYYTLFYTTILCKTGVLPHSHQDSLDSRKSSLSHHRIYLREREGEEYLTLVHRTETRAGTEHSITHTHRVQSIQTQDRDTHRRSTQ